MKIETIWEGKQYYLPGEYAGPERYSVVMKLESVELTSLALIQINSKVPSKTLILRVMFTQTLRAFGLVMLNYLE